MENLHEALSIERIKQARETLTQAFRLDIKEFKGARGAVDWRGTIIEAKRNLGALTFYLHGEDALDKLLIEEKP